MKTHVTRVVRAIQATVRRPAFVPDGHFYSPVPSSADVVRAIAARERRDSGSMAGIDLRVDSQRELWDRLVPLLPELPHAPDAAWRYSSSNGMYGIADALLYAAILRLDPPRRIIEVGSGFTTALALDIADRFGLNIAITCIEPFPQRLRSLLRPDDAERVRIIEAPVQDVPLSEFSSLGRGDLLFIDSTHVSKAGSDVNRLFFEVIPSLSPGVDIHIHDIFWPFEYPASWLREGRAFTELYLLRAFLTNNDHWQIKLFGSWLWNEHGPAREALERECRARSKDSYGEPGSIWLTNRNTGCEEDRAG